MERARKTRARARNHFGMCTISPVIEWLRSVVVLFVICMARRRCLLHVVEQQEDDLDWTRIFSSHELLWLSTSARCSFINCCFSLPASSTVRVKWLDLFCIMELCCFVRLPKMLAIEFIPLLLPERNNFYPKYYSRSWFQVEILPTKSAHLLYV